MILSRAWPRPALRFGATQTRWPSGPRWSSRRTARVSESPDTTPRPATAAMMPHMGFSFKKRRRQNAAPRIVEGDVGDALQHSRTRSFEQSGGGRWEYLPKVRYDDGPPLGGAVGRSDPGDSHYLQRTNPIDD